MFSEKAYKDQFREWKWEKNLKKPLVAFMVNKAEERNVLGKDTKFEYRGVEVPNAKLRRYSKMRRDPGFPFSLRTPSGVDY